MVKFVLRAAPAWADAVNHLPTSETLPDRLTSTPLASINPQSFSSNSLTARPNASSLPESNASATSGNPCRAIAPCPSGPKRPGPASADTGNIRSAEAARNVDKCLCCGHFRSSLRTHFVRSDPQRRNVYCRGASERLCMPAGNSLDMTCCFTVSGPAVCTARLEPRVPTHTGVTGPRPRSVTLPRNIRHVSTAPRHQLQYALMLHRCGTRKPPWH